VEFGGRGVGIGKDQDPRGTRGTDRQKRGRERAESGRGAGWEKATGDRTQILLRPGWWVEPGPSQKIEVGCHPPQPLAPFYAGYKHRKSLNRMMQPPFYVSRPRDMTLAGHLPDTVRTQDTTVLCPCG
jgi:hypothetical protein